MARSRPARLALTAAAMIPALALAQAEPPPLHGPMAAQHPIIGMAGGTALFVVAIVTLSLLFGFLREKRRHDLIARFVDKGQEIPPSLLPQGPSRHRELRRGTWLTFLGLGLGIALYTVGGLWMAVWSVILLFLGAASFVNAMLFYPGDDRRP
jgi:hypothetical protein